MKHEAEFNTSEEYIKYRRLEEDQQRRAEALAEDMSEQRGMYREIASHIKQVLERIEELKDAIPADYDEDISMLIISATSHLEEALDKASSYEPEPEPDPEPDPGYGHYVWWGRMVDDD